MLALFEHENENENDEWIPSAGESHPTFFAAISRR
jgi:hypothetical protein